MLPAQDLAAIRECKLFLPFLPIGRLATPDGYPGFHIGPLLWAADAREQLTALRAAQSTPVATELTIGGQPVTVLHPPFELGSVEDLFDGKPYTTPRCFRGIPMTIELRFPSPRALAAVRVAHRDRTEFCQHVSGYAGGVEVVSQDDHVLREEADPIVTTPMKGQALDRLCIEVREGPEDWVHLREIVLEDVMNRVR